jgi:hypothetical protein
LWMPSSSRTPSGLRPWLCDAAGPAPV